MTELEEFIGYRFGRQTLLQTALTHSSYANERGGESNERLEFLGDAVLNLITARALFDKHPGMGEGELTRARAMLICERNLAKGARHIGLWRHLRLGGGERNSEPKPSVLADAFEALTAALWLDGGEDAARVFLERFLPAAGEAQDHKSLLQVRAQGRGLPAPRYETLSAEGPPHARVFTVRVLIDGREAGRGAGKSKKAAEQDAARAACGAMGA
jgi:ribonuclease-3